MVAGAFALGLASGAAAACVGDCDADGDVDIGELVVGVSIALGAQPTSACPGLPDPQGEVGVARLILAVSNALSGCPPASTPSSTPAATSTASAATTSPTASHSAIASATPTATRSSQPTATSSAEPTATRSAIPTATPTRSSTPTTTHSAPPTPTHSVTPTATLDSSTPMLTVTDTPAVATPTPTATQPNQPPQLPTPFLYRGFTEQPIALPLAAIDPDGGAVQCTADDLADGMALSDNVLHWMPSASQAGPYIVPFTCRDAAAESVSGELALHVTPDDACLTPSCDAALGCTATLKAPAISCCSNDDAARLVPFPPTCPLGRQLQIGRNGTGFGPLQNCDPMRIRTFQQSGAEFAINIRVACFAPGSRVPITVRLQTSTRGLAVDGTQTITLPTEVKNGYLEKRGLRFAVLGGSPFFDLGEVEANLTVTARDPSDGVTISRTVRVFLTFGSISDLPDP